MYGDFSCPWSYLASRRASLLADSGAAQVDWRPWGTIPRRCADPATALRGSKHCAPTWTGSLLRCCPARRSPVVADRRGPGRSLPSELLREWGYAVDVTGAPITTTAWRLRRGWIEGWRGTGKEVVPVLAIDGAEPIFGEAAVDWLGDELGRQGVDVDPGTEPMSLTPRVGVDVEDLPWVTQYGGRWLRTYQDAHMVRSWARAG